VAAANRDAPRSRGGFTLLEVLVAVAVLGLLYTVLAGIAAQGLRAEGESGRELRASLLADLALAEIEGGLELGVVPPVGPPQEREEEGYAVEIEVAPLPDLELPADGSPLEREESAVSLLRGGRGGSASPLRRIDVRVRWSEGVRDREVRRTTFALDREAAAPVLERLVASQEARERDDEEPEEEGEDEPQPAQRRRQGSPLRENDRGRARGAE
jgi:prepilin-type N-terminal cleavage/methylation domain-containing protein